MSGYADIKKFQDLKSEIIRTEARESFDAGVPPDQINVELGAQHADKLFAQAKQGGISPKEEKELAFEAFNQKTDEPSVKLVGDPGSAYDAAENFGIRVTPTTDYRDQLIAHLKATLGEEKIEGLKAGHIKSSRKASREFGTQPSREALEAKWRIFNHNPLYPPSSNLLSAWKSGDSIADVPPAGKA